MVAFLNNRHYPIYITDLLDVSYPEGGIIPVRFLIFQSLVLGNYKEESVFTYFLRYVLNDALAEGDIEN